MSHVRQVLASMRCWTLAMAAVALASCSGSSIVAEGPVPVLEKPYPIGYPSSGPLPNSIVGTLGAGTRVRVRREGYGKDFKYYEVAIPGGDIGFVIVGTAPFHVE